MKSLYSFLSRVESASNVKLNTSIATNPTENLLKKFILRIAGVVALLLVFGGVSGQNAIVGPGFSTGWNSGCNNANFKYLTSSAGSSWGLTTQANATGNSFFRLGVDWNGSQYAVSTGTSGINNAVVPNTTYTSNATCDAVGTMFYNVPNTAFNYIFKTSAAGTTVGGNGFVFFEVQGAVRTVSSVSQSPVAASVVAGPVTVNATLSGSLSSGQAVYLRYTTNNFSASTVVQMTGSGSAYSATIPGNLVGTNVSYYVFTSGTANVATNGTNADLYTINLNNNGGSNFSYTVGGSNVIVTNPTNTTPNLASTYSTLSAAITALNAVTAISGPVTITLGANETAPAGGYSITAAPTGVSATNNITIQGSGSTITAFTPQTSGSLNDAIFKIIGSDFITIQNFVMQENASNTATTATSNNMTEFGVALFYATTTNGAQNCTIQGNTIILNRTYQNTFGIYSNSTHSATNMTSSATATSAAGGNSGLKVYGNTISNVNLGFVVVGPTAAADFNTGIDIGGTASGTGNTISNFGTTGTFSNFANLSGTVYGIFIRNSIGFNVSYNSITSSNGGVTAGTLRGIFNMSASNAPTGTFTNNINNNTIALTYGVSTGTLQGITVEATNATTTSIGNINNNNFTALTASLATSATITAISTVAPHLTLSISGNTFTNLSTNTTGSFTFFGHSYSMPAGGSQTISGNSIVTAFNKTAANGNITLFTTGGSSPSSASISYTNNNLSNIICSGSTSITGINNTDGAGTSPSKTITGNTFSNWTAATGAITAMSFTYWGGGTTNNLSSNTISNLTTQAAITAIFIGSTFSSTNTVTVSGNTISNLSSTGSAGAVLGITCSNTTTIIDINGNTINTLSSTGASAVTAISISGATTTNVFQNKIYDISGSNASSTVNGILISAGTTINTYNNVIGDLRTTAANAANPLVGINITGGTTSNVYFNTVRIAGSSTGALFGSSALSVSTTPTVNSRNNILVNTSTVNGTGLAVAYRRSTTTLTTYGSTSNNNQLFGTSGLFADGSSTYTTLAAYKTAMSTRDQGSISESVTFQSTTGSSADFLKYSTTVATQLESGGTPVSGITTDFANTTRNVSTPDIGAWELLGIASDLTGPTIAYTTLSNTGCASGATLSATITDASGVNSNSGTKPRMYYKKSTDANAYVGNTAADNGWKYVESSSSASPFNFTMNSALFQTALTQGDVIQYFVIAQDNAGTPNVGIASGTFAATPTSVALTSSSFGISGTINSYTILNPIATSVTVGSGGTYPTLTGATGLFAAINAGGLSANTTATVISNITEDGSVALNQINYGCAGAVTLTIKPQTTATISGSVATAVIKINGADNVIIDGSNNGGTDKSLTIENTNTSTSSAVIWIGSASSTNGALNNTVKNIIAKGNGPTTTLAGIMAGSGTTLGNAAEAENSNLTILNNTCIKSQYGIDVVGNSTYQAGTIISGNTVGSNTSLEYIGFRGIFIMNTASPTISNNTISNIIVSGSFNVSGIEIASGVVNGSITSNNISNIKNTTSSGYGAYGINFNSATGTTGVLVSNNMISGIETANYSTTSNIYNGFGIRIAAAVPGLKIYNNTISLFGSVASGSSAGMSACFVTTTAVTGLDLRNNIFSNTQTFGVSGSFAYNFYLTSGTTFTDINFNNYYGTSGTNTTYNLGYNGTATNSNLTAWASFTTKDAQSLAVLPTFVSATDLHLNTASNCNLDGAGTSISSVTTDYDGDNRNATTPDIGADEFTAVLPTITLGSNPQVCSGTTSANLTYSATTGSPNRYMLNFNTAAETAGFLDVGYTTLPSSPISIVVPANAAEGTYTATLRIRNAATGCTSSGYTVNVVINSVPTVTVNSPTTCQGTSTTVTATPSDANTYSYAWTVPSGVSDPGNVASFSASTAGIYSVVITNTATNCASTSASGQISYIAAVAISSHPANQAVLTNNSAIFNVVASGAGLSYQWQVNDNINGWVSISGATSDTYTISTATESMNNYQYRCVVSGTCGTLNSNSGLLTVSSTSITAHPQSQSVCVGSLATFTITTSGSEPTYQWEEYITSWSPISNGGIYSGATSSTLTLNGFTSTQNGYLYRCVLNGSIVSNSASLSVSIPSVAGTASSNQAICQSTTPANITLADNTGSIQWQVSSDNSSFSNISTGTSATLSSALLGSLTSTRYYRAIVTNGACSSATSNVVTVTVTAQPSAGTLSGTQSACVNASTTFSSNGNAGGAWTSSNPAVATVDITSGVVTGVSAGTATITYTVTGTGGCSNATATRSVTVNPNPSITSATASPSAVCSGSSVSLSAASITPSAGTAAVGSGASTSYSVGGSMFPGGWGGAKTQYLIRSSDLLAAGVVAGNITSLAFEATSSGQSYPGFALSIGSTVLTTMPNSFQSGLTQVYSNSGFTPSVGVNTLTFTSPFLWDGSSNILVSFCWSTALTTSSSSTVKTDVAAYTCTYGWNVDSQSSATVCGTTGPASGGNTAVNGTTRPKFIFGGQVGTNNTANFNWSWNTIPAVTLATGQTTAANNTASAATQTYTVTATNPTSGCTSTASTSAVTINAIPASPTATNSTQCGTGVPTGSLVSNAGTTTPNMNWYTNSTTNYYSNDFASSVGTGTLLGNATLNSGRVQLTPSSTAQSGTFDIPASGINPAWCKVTFDIYTSAAAQSGADGISYSFGDDVTTVSYNEEHGSGTKLKVSFDAYDTDPTSGKLAGIRLIYGTSSTAPGQAVGTNGVLAFSSDVSWTNGTYPVVIDINTTGQLTLTVNGSVIFSNVQLPAAYLSANKSTWSHRFRARTGGVFMTQAIDNLVIKQASLSGTTSYPNSISSTTTFYVTETLNGCESATATPIAFTVNTPPAFSLSASSATTCSGISTSTPVTVATGGSDYDTYSWSPSATVSGSAASGWSFNPSTNTTYTLTATQSSGNCANSATYAVTANALPSVSFTASPAAAICSSTNAVYTTQSGQSNYVWNVPGISGTDYTIVSGGISSTSNTVTITWLTAGSKTVTVNYSNSNGCTAASPVSNTTTVTVSPTTSVAGSAQSICANASATLAANAPTVGTGAWTVTSGPSTSATQISSTSNPSAVFTPAGGMGSYVLTWTISNGTCTSSSNVTINVNASPAVLTVTSNSAAICSGSVATLVASGGGLSGTALNQNFDTGGLPVGWSRGTAAYSSGDFRSTSETSSSGNTWGSSGYGGTGNCMFFYTYLISSGVSGYMETPANDLSSYSSVTLSFYIYNSGGTDVLKVFAKNGAAGTYAQIGLASYGVYAAWTQVNITLPATYFGTGANAIFIKFQGTSDYGGSNIAVDNVVLSGTTASPITWSPSTTLFTDAAATTAYTGTSAATVYAKPTTTTTYTATATSAAGCTSSNTVQVSVNQPSVAPTSLSASSSTICNGGSATLTQTGGSLGTGAVWQWYTNANFTTAVGSTLSSADASLTVTPTTTTTYYLRAINGTAPCATAVPATVPSTVSVTITVNQPSVAPTSISGTTTICNGASATLTAIGGTLGTGATYEWGTGSEVGTNPIAGSGVSVTVSPGATTTYWVRIVNGTSPCTATTSGVTATVTVNALPTVTANADQTVCSGTSVTLVGGGAASYTWTGGVTNNTAFTAAATTTYVVTGTDANGCANTASSTVTVNPLPTVTAGNNARCGEGQVTLYASNVSSGATTDWYEFATGGSALALAVPQYVTPSLALTTTYYVEARNITTGCVSATRIPVTATVNAIPTVTATASQTVCAGTIVTLAGSGAASYAWTGGITDNTAFAATSTQTYTVTGTTNGCSSTATSTVTVNPTPVVTNMTASICSGSSFTATPANGTNGNIPAGTTYTWAAPTTANIQGLLSGTTASSISGTLFNTTNAAIDAVYTVTPTAPTGSCAGTPFTVTVTVNALPVVTAATPAPVCAGTGVTLSGQGATTYVWNNGVTNGEVFTPTETAYYSVTGTDANGCINSGGVFVTVNPSPTALSITGPQCLPSSSALATITSTTSVVGVNYQLYNSDGAQGSPIAGTGSALIWNGVVQANGIYVQGAGTNGCTSSSNSVDAMFVTGSSAFTYYADADGDGSFSMIPTTGCSLPVGSSLTVGTDCNDNNAAIRPGATEVCGDGIDNDCTGGDAFASLYRSAASGDWSSASTWQTSCDNAIWSLASIAPTGDNYSAANPYLITVQNNHTVTVSTTSTTNCGKAGSLTINSGGTVVVNGKLTVVNAFVNNGALTINNGGSFVQNSTTTANTGNGTYTVKMDLSGSNNGTAATGRYWFIGSPMNNTSASTFYDPASLARLWQYNATVNSWPSVITTTATNTSLLVPGIGYLYRAGAAKTFTYTGGTSNFNNNITTSLLPASVGAGYLPVTGYSNSAGYKFVSNPYPSHLDWNLVTRTGLNVSYWIRTADNTNYESYNATSGLSVNNISGQTTRFIPPMQGFFVYAFNTTPTLRLDNTDRVHSGNVLHSPVYNQVVRLKLNDGKTNDEALVYENENASNGLEEYDTYKMFDTQHHQLYFMEGIKELTMDGLNDATAKQKVDMGIQITGAGTYTINATELGIEEDVVLEDKFTHTFQDLKRNSTYSFTSNAGTFNNRFVLHFTLNPQTETAIETETVGVTETEGETEGVSVYTTTGQQVKVWVTNTAEFQNATVKVYDAIGNMIERKNMTSNELYLDLDIASGIYVVELTGAEKTFTKKVFISK